MNHRVGICDKESEALQNLNGSKKKLKQKRECEIKGMKLKQKKKEFKKSHCCF